MLILDLTDEEADEELAFHDAIGAWAGFQPLALQALLDKARADNEEMAAARGRLAAEIADQVAVARRALGLEDAPPREPTTTPSAWPRW